MRIVIFSDIHGNSLALEQMLLDVRNENIKAYLFVGDIWGYFFEQDKCLSIIKNLPNVYAIKGNHDANYLVACRNSSYRREMIDRYGESYRNICSQENREWIDSIPCKLEIQLANKKICMVHGNLENHLDGRIYPDYKKSILGEYNYDMLILGHTHYRFHKKEGNSLIINPGSLGQPRDKNGFSYVIYDLDKDKAEFRSVRIDIKRLINDINIIETSTSNKNYLLRKLIERE